MAEVSDAAEKEATKVALALLVLIGMAVICLIDFKLKNEILEAVKEYGRLRGEGGGGQAGSDLGSGHNNHRVDDSSAAGGSGPGLANAMEDAVSKIRKDSGRTGRVGERPSRDQDGAGKG